MKKMPVGYQLYSARELVAKDMKSVLLSIKEMGYDGVEFAGFFHYTAKEIADMLAEAGLKAVSSHVPLASIEADMYGTISFHKAIGCDTIVVPYLEGPRRPGLPAFAKVMQSIYTFGELCRMAGIRLLYHNHDFEFVDFSGMYALDFMYDAIPADMLQTEIDVCWVKYSGVNPAEYLMKYTGRCPVVHLKDYVGEKGRGTPYGLLGLDKEEDAECFEFRPFGHGCQDVESVVEAGIAAGAEWFIIEQDQWYDRCPLEAARMSMDTLKKIGLK